MNFDINGILIIAGIVGAIGAILGLILAIASEAFKVEVDPRFEKLMEALPGFNCGACGFPGCSGMAEGLIEGNANINSCNPATDQTKASVKAILEGKEVTESGEAKPKRVKPEIIDVTNDDPRFAKIVELLPGLNCTTCGAPGCKAFADELIKGSKELDNCRPLNKKTENKDKIKELLK